ncbi:baseplate J/gp47 family protein [Metabacillus idriensis]|uniref:baseplate J/gp47 family protein n=1 Tax=Metabacillus idriensis TaxID=324768 RepID=UPI00203F06C9|nr:baseplate J/gp47 family protein [Metabacillus idriensis]MCM3598723.1 baseplate J/gp47 family protein [Metabacillus idriensis]
MPWGLDSSGFNRPNQADIKEELDQRQRELFGDDINLNAKSPNGIISSLFAWFFARLYELAEKVYHSGHVSQAEGVQLDYKTAEFNTFRQPQLYAEVILTFTGTAGATLLAGTRFETAEGIDYALKTNVVLDWAGNGTGEAVSLNPGTIGNASANTITVQSEPSADVLTVNNTAAASGGREEESDEELRNRLLKSGAGNGSGTTSSILSAVLGVAGVRTANINVNNTNAVVSGQPAKSFQVYALGGNGQEIAEAIFEKGAAGIEPYGTTTFSVTDISGTAHTVKYTPASQVSIFSSITLTVDNTFPTDGVTQVKNAIVKFIGGTTSDGSIYTGLNMGEDVIYSKILSAVMSIQGVQDATVQIRKTGGTLATSNIAISASEVAQINDTDITVTV